MQLENLKTRCLGKNSIYYKEIDSTQKEIWRLIKKENIPNGTLVLADIQTEGQGTHGRKWYTDESNNIAFSILIKTNCNIKKLEGLTMKIAQIIIDIFKTKYNIRLSIKEPNDIVCKGKKIGGILTQITTVSENVKYLVIGVGINTNKEKFTNDIIKIATSIKKEFKIEVNTYEFISNFCNEFEEELVKRLVI